MKSLVRHLVRFSCILGLASCATQKPLPPGPGGADPQKELTNRVQASSCLGVLFVGNSYSFGLPKEFSKLAVEKGKVVRVGQSTFGGWTLALHAAYEPTLKKIRDGQWDIVVIQEQSEIPALAPRKRTALMFPPLRQLVKEVRDNGAIPVLYQTWGRRDGDKHIRNDDFHAMSARLRDGYRAAAANAGGLVVVPVGDAWERKLSAGKGNQLFMEDGSHPSAFGKRVIAESFYQTLWPK